MDKFLEWVKEYIAEQFANDKSIKKAITIENAYKQGNKVTTENVPQIQIQIMDNAEVTRYTTFYEGENVSSIPLQIISYIGQMKIDGIMKSAQEASIIFGTKIKEMFAKSKVVSVNENIKYCRRTAMSPALPLLDGSKAYTTAVRFDFWIANPYVVEEIIEEPQEEQDKEN